MRPFITRILLSAILIIAFLLFYTKKDRSYCFTGAFLADNPTKEDIKTFKDRYGKKPFLAMVFIDWSHFINEEIIYDIYSEDCVLFITWEPWDAVAKEGIDFDELLSGEYDSYIMDFAERLEKVKGAIFIRFAHEMNGDWYPWSGIKIGKDKSIEGYRYIKDIFDEMDLANVKWVFSINWEDVPKENNSFMLYYPGDEYVDFIGIDGYNWGNTKAWSRWMSFKEIFEKRYNEITNNFKKPIVISEFSSTSSGGDKGIWIKEAMSDIKRMKDVKAFILFNVDKETDWSFPAEENWGKELKRQLKNRYFKDRDFDIINR